MKRTMGVVSTVLLTGTMVFGGANGLAHADATSKTYQIVTPGEHNEKPVTVGFDTQKELESYIKKHPVVPNLSKTFQSSMIYSTFYHNIHLKGL